MSSSTERWQSLPIGDLTVNSMQFHQQQNGMKYIHYATYFVINMNMGAEPGGVPFTAS
jgi:hypothetical protein